MYNFLPPNICHKYCVIVNNDDYHLAAVISSFLFEKEKYLPVFGFPEVEVFAYQEVEVGLNREYVGKSEAIAFGVQIRNVLAFLKSCDTIILGGLSAVQKSFIEISEDKNIIEIENTTDIDVLIAISSKTDWLECKPEEINLGLIIAQRSNQYLILNKNADTLKPYNQSSEKGVVVIENLENASVIIAINYALSINSFPVIVARPSISMNEVNEYVSDWRKTGNDRFLNDLRHVIYSSIEHLSFEDFQFATFFTIGIPYSLIVENVIPCTHVNLILRPGFFLLYTILAETRSPTYSSVVFSTEEFKNEETHDVISILDNHAFHVKEVLGSLASCANLDYHIKEFPFDLFHICAHGGEVQGTPMSTTVYDQNGSCYTFEYDFVLSFAPYPKMDKIAVTKLYFPKSLDGLPWKSKELKSRGFSSGFYENIFKQISDDQGTKVGDPITVHNSFGINCHDFVYTGQFNNLAGVSSFPIIYNNTCWSWGELSKSFLNSGARMYIGNLWDIDNDIATTISKKFYSLVFDRTVLEALFISIQDLKGTPNYWINVIWGLHFSTLKRGKSTNESKYGTALKLWESYYRWHKHKEQVSEAITLESIEYQMKWIKSQLYQYYQNEVSNLKLRLDKD